MRVIDNPFGLRPEEALRWFREKGYQLTFDWRDMWQEAHARAFTVAKATQLDVLADLRYAVDRAIANGESRGQFRKQLKPTLQEKGWWGEQERVDPVTGERRMVQLGSARRLDTILATNRRQAMAAARWERIERTAQTRPYLRYVCVLDGRERLEHRKWHGIILPWDDPWWNEHYPPNGWGCRCSVMQLSDSDLRRYGLTVSKSAPRVRREQWANERTGQIVQVPRGIDPGFAYNAGKAQRGWTPPDNAPPLSGARTFRDYSRPSSAEVQQRPQSPAQWPPVSRERARDLWATLFGAEEATVHDPTGDGVAFTPRYLEHLARNKDTSRIQHVPVARAAVEDPFEIWMVPVRLKDGTVAMRKRYVGLFDDGAEGGGELVVVDRGDDGYAAWTSYPRRDLDSKREGYLLYARP